MNNPLLSTITEKQLKAAGFVRENDDDVDAEWCFSTDDGLFTFFLSNAKMHNKFVNGRKIFLIDLLELVYNAGIKKGKEQKELEIRNIFATIRKITGRIT
jgi:hypothetical protein